MNCFFINYISFVLKIRLLLVVKETKFNATPNINKPQQDRQHNDQKKKDKRTNNDQQNIINMGNIISVRTIYQA
jgi:hypothetical protein